MFSVLFIFGTTTKRSSRFKVYATYLRAVYFSWQKVRIGTALPGSRSSQARGQVDMV